MSDWLCLSQAPNVGKDSLHTSNILGLTACPYDTSTLTIWTKSYRKWFLTSDIFRDIGPSYHKVECKTVEMVVILRRWLETKKLEPFVTIYSPSHTGSCVQSPVLDLFLVHVMTGSLPAFRLYPSLHRNVRVEPSARPLLSLPACIPFSTLPGSEQYVVISIETKGNRRSKQVLQFKNVPLAQEHLAGQKIEFHRLSPSIKKGSFWRYF